MLRLASSGKSNPVRCHILKRLVGRLFEAEIDRNQGEARPPSRCPRVLGDKFSDQWSDLGQAPLLTADRKHLYAINSRCDVGLDVVG